MTQGKIIKVSGPLVVASGMQQPELPFLLNWDQA